MDAYDKYLLNLNVAIVRYGVQVFGGCRNLEILFSRVPSTENRQLMERMWSTPGIDCINQEPELTEYLFTVRTYHPIDELAQSIAQVIKGNGTKVEVIADEG